MSHIDSRFIKFLRQYGPIPQNSNMYDELIQRTLRRGRQTPIAFESEYLPELIANFRSADPQSVVLTGTAGDGKTYLTREIWTALGGDLETWDRGEPIQKLKLEHCDLTVIKDLSEVSADCELSEMAEAVLSADGGRRSVYLVAANDGQLIEAWKKLRPDSAVTEVRSLIEELLVEDKREISGRRLRLYNLSRVSAAHLIGRVLDAVLGHPGWSECGACEFSSAEGGRRCPIFENKLRLDGKGYGGEIVRKRLMDLLQLCELNDIHVPVRQLLLLVSNAILGHPDAKDSLLTCKDIPQIVETGSTSGASLYRNLLGENLGERRRNKIGVFRNLGAFGVGNETNNRSDNLLIFGADDPVTQDPYRELVQSDEYYGADSRFRAAQLQYLEGSFESRGEGFLDLLRAQRQRLFFVLPYEKMRDMRLWELTVFQHGGEYLEEVYRALVDRNEKLSKGLISKLVRGLNRIFTGLLLKNHDELVLATSGSHSQSKVSRVLEEVISVTRSRGESVSVEKDSNGKLFLNVSVSTLPEVPPARIQLSLIRYEFLCRVAEGALPDSFSRECYEDILAFKTQILKRLEKRRAHEDSGQEESGVRVRIIELDNEGMMRPKSLEVR